MCTNEADIDHVREKYHNHHYPKVVTIDIKDIAVIAYEVHMIEIVSDVSKTLPVCFPVFSKQPQKGKNNAKMLFPTLFLHLLGLSILGQCAEGLLNDCSATFVGSGTFIIEIVGSVIIT